MNDKSKSNQHHVLDESVLESVNGGIVAGDGGCVLTPRRPHWIKRILPAIRNLGRPITLK